MQKKHASAKKIAIVNSDTTSSTTVVFQSSTVQVKNIPVATTATVVSTQPSPPPAAATAVMPKKTIPVLSKFEKAALISQRSAQIASGSPLTFRNEQRLTNPIELAKEEFRLKTIPLKVIRILPDGTEEVWHVREFKW